MVCIPRREDAKSAMKKALVLGCGTIKYADAEIDYTFVDVNDHGFNKVADLNKPWDFAGDEEFDMVIAENILEHLDSYDDAMREIYRVLKKGGCARIVTPHLSSYQVECDPSHKHGSGWETFKGYYCKRHRRVDNYYYDFSFDHATVRLKFDKVWCMPWNWLIEPLVNMNDKTLRYYEASFMKALFPCKNTRTMIYK